MAPDQASSDDLLRWHVYVRMYDDDGAALGTRRIVRWAKTDVEAAEKVREHGLMVVRTCPAPPASF